MELVKIKLKNFLSYKSLEYDFVNKPLLVQGSNLTDDEQGSNGSGKSGLQTGIEFCITASNSRGVRDNELISYGEKEALASLVVFCKVRKEEIQIDWTIKAKGSNKLEITKRVGDGNWEEVSFSNVNDGKKWIINWFGISKDDLFNYFLINKSRFKSFFESSNKEKVELINRFSDASIIEGLEDVDTTDLESNFRKKENEEIKLETKIELKNEELQKELGRNLGEEFDEIIEDIDDDIANYFEKIDLLKKTNNFHKVNIDTIGSKNEDSKKEILENQEELSLLESKIEEKEKGKVKLIERLKLAQASVDNFKGISNKGKIDILEQNIIDKKGEIKSSELKNVGIRNSAKKVQKLINEIDVKLGGEIVCPSCKYGFVLNSDLTIDELKEKLASSKDIILKYKEQYESEEDSQKVLNSSLNELGAKIQDLRKEENDSLEGKKVFIKVLDNASSNLYDYEVLERGLVREKGDLKNLIKDISLDIDRRKESIKTIEGKIKNNAEDIETFDARIIELEGKKKALEPLSNKSDITTLKKELSALELLKTSIAIDKSKIGDEIYNLKQWKLNFKQFRLHLANQSLNVMEYHTNRYLKDMKSDLIVNFDGYKTLANGSIKDEITCKIVRGVERTFSSFSGGEKGRLLFASILANRYMINSTHKYGGLDFLSVDEVFEGVDAIGLKGLIKSARDLEIAVMIITHVSDENVSDDILLIEKVNGVSNIKR